MRTLVGEGEEGGTWEMVISLKGKEEYDSGRAGTVMFAGGESDGGMGCVEAIELIELE